jgi:hypothetical protein
MINIRILLQFAFIVVLITPSFAATLSFISKPRTANMIWDISNPWFEIQNLLGEIPLVDQETKVDISSLPEMFDIDPFFLTPDAIRKFSRNRTHSDPTPLQLRSRLALREFLRTYFFPKYVLGHRQLAIFKDSTINDRGVIYDPKVRRFAANGGCHDRFVIPTKPHGNVTSYENVLSVSAVWVMKPWHLAMEASTAFAHLDPAIITRSHIHVSQINNFTISWMSLFGIDKSKLISGTVKAETLYIPEMGRCGSPSQLQLQWLRTKLLPPPDQLTPTNLVLIKRISRALPHFAEVRTTLGSLAAHTNFTMVIHDEKALPTMQEQILQFAKAAVVVAPHGAGELFNAFLPRGACVIEYNNYEKNPVYARMAMMLNTSYVMINMATLNMDNLKQWLRRCPLLRSRLISKGVAGAVELGPPPPFQAVPPTSPKNPKSGRKKPKTSQLQRTKKAASTAPRLVEVRRPPAQGRWAAKKKSFSKQPKT